MTQELDNLRKKHEKRTAEILTDLLTEAVRAEPVRVAAWDSLGQEDPGRGAWPAEDSREVMNVLNRALNKAFGKLRGEYRNYVVDKDVSHPRGAPPVVKVRARYKFNRVGGVTRVIKSGETIRSMAKWHYGHACYGNTVWEENSKWLGSGCQQVPAGFPVVLPTLEVPDWDMPPRVKPPKGCFAKAVRIVYPTLYLSVDGSSSRKVGWATDDFSIEVTLRFRGNVLVQKKGTVGPDFNFKRYLTDAGRVLDDVMSMAFQFQAEDKRGTLNVKLTNRKAKRLQLGGQLKLTTGGPKLRLSGNGGEVTHKDHAMVFMMNVEAVFRIVPRKAGKPVQTFNTPLSVSTNISSDGLAPRPLIPPRGTHQQASPKGTAAVLVKMGVV